MNNLPPINSTWISPDSNTSFKVTHISKDGVITLSRNEFVTLEQLEKRGWRRDSELDEIFLKPVKEPRYLVTVLARIILILDEGKLKSELNEVLDDVLYMAPEQCHPYWVICTKIVNSHITKPYDELNEVEKKVVDIWMDKE